MISSRQQYHAGVMSYDAAMTRCMLSRVSGVLHQVCSIYVFTGFLSFGLSKAGCVK